MTRGNAIAAFPQLEEVKMKIKRSRHQRKRVRREALSFYLFISPMLVGVLVFTAFPIVASLILSFSRWNLISPPNFVGFKNFVRIFTKDKFFWISLSVTLRFALMSVPIDLAGAFVVALLLNQKVRGQGLFRTLWYAPAVVPAVAVAVLWIAIFDRQAGILNRTLAIVGIDGPNWLWSSTWILPAFVIMGLWSAGGTMLICLAALQGVPSSLYEVAVLDGAGWWKKFWHITMPMVSPAIFFNLIMGSIGVFQYFTNAYIMTEGGPGSASLFYALYLYRNAFLWQRMGYASALAWILFCITLVVTLLLFKSGSRWVFYEFTEEKG